MSSRRYDVKALGTIVRQLRAADALYRSELFEITIAEQDGVDLSGGRHPVSARTVHGRRTLNMRDHGVELEPGDSVAVILNPRPNRHVVPVIAVIHAERR